MSRDAVPQKTTIDGRQLAVRSPELVRECIGLSSTDGLSEGKNLYYTDARVKALGVEFQSNRDTDSALSANSDGKYCSQKAAKTYIDKKQAPLGFGDGADGNLICDGVNAVAGMTLVAANIYRVDRDIYAADLTVSSGVTVKVGNSTAGSTPTWKLFVAGTLTNNGTIHCDGTNATDAVLSTQGAAGGAAGNGGGSLGGAGNGGIGRTATTGVGTNGAGGTLTDPSQGGSGGSGGAGGNGINGGGGAGAGGVATLRPFRFISPTLITLSSTGVITTLRGGSGAGSGGAGGGNGTALGGGSGGGGGGGGIVFIWAKSILNSITGIIRSNGGNGGNGGAGGTAGGGATGGGAGGGGGGGGFVYLAYESLTNAGVIQANGGNFGTGGAPGNAGTAGANGVAGGDGAVVKFNAKIGVYES